MIAQPVTSKSIPKHGFFDTAGGTLRIQAPYWLPRRLSSPWKPPSTNAIHLDMCRSLSAFTHSKRSLPGLGACESLDQAIQSP